MNIEDIQLTEEFMFQRKVATLTQFELHRHDVLEISILQKNNIRYKLAQGDYIGKPGDVYVFRPFEPHRNLAEHEEQPAAWIMLLASPTIMRLIPDGFSLLAPFYTIDWTPLIPAHSAEAIIIQEVADFAMKEQEMLKPGWKTKQFSCLIDILVQIYRYYMNHSSSTQSNKEAMSQGVVTAVELLLQRFQNDIDMNEIISLSGLKKTTFYNQFLNLTALTPNQFINRLRLQHAIYLLLHSSFSITDIAFESGFSSVSYFNRQFKDYRGISPRQYRTDNSTILS